MVNINKKLWSFNLGCVFAGSIVWLVSLGQAIPVPTPYLKMENFDLAMFQQALSGIIGFIFTLTVLMVMKVKFALHPSQHTFWLVTPIVAFTIITALAANVMVPTVLTTAIPMLFAILFTAALKRIKSVKQAETETAS